MTSYEAEGWDLVFVLLTALRSWPWHSLLLPSLICAWFLHEGPREDFQSPYCICTHLSWRWGLGSDGCYSWGTLDWIAQHLAHSRCSVNSR